MKAVLIDELDEDLEADMGLVRSLKITKSMA